MPAKACWMIENEVILLEYIGWIEAAQLLDTYTRIGIMIDQSQHDVADLIVDATQAENIRDAIDYGLAVMPYSDLSRVKNLVLVVPSSADMLMLARAFNSRRQRSPSGTIPDIRFAPDHETALRYIVQAGGASASQS